MRRRCCRRFARLRLASVLALGSAAAAGALIIAAPRPAHAGFVANGDGSYTDTFETYNGGQQNVPGANTDQANSQNVNYFDIFSVGNAGTDVNVYTTGNGSAVNGVVSTASSHYYGTYNQLYGTSTSTSGVKFQVPGSNSSTFYFNQEPLMSNSTVDGGTNSMEAFFQLSANATTGSGTSRTSTQQVGSSYVYNGKTYQAYGFDRIVSNSPSATPNTSGSLEDGRPVVDLGGTVSFYVYVDVGIPGPYNSTPGVYAQAPGTGKAYAAGQAPVALELGISEDSADVGAVSLATSATTSNYDVFEDQGNTGTGGNGASAGTTSGNFPVGGIYVTNGSWQKVTFNLATDSEAFAFANAVNGTGTQNTPSRSGLGFIYDMGITPLYNSSITSGHPTYTVYIDDLTISPATLTSSASPEPSAAVLAVIGLMLPGLTTAARKQRQGRRERRSR